MIQPPPEFADAVLQAIWNHARSAPEKKKPEPRGLFPELRKAQRDFVENVAPRSSVLRSADGNSESDPRRPSAGNTLVLLEK